MHTSVTCLLRYGSHRIFDVLPQSLALFLGRPRRKYIYPFCQNKESLTGQYMSGEKRIEIPAVRHKAKTMDTEIKGKAKAKKTPMIGDR